MENLKEKLLKNYSDSNIYIRRKAEYGMTFLLILIFIMFFLSIFKSVFVSLTILEHVINVVNFLGFIIIFYFMYKGKLSVGVTLLTLLGVARALSILMIYEVSQFYIFLPVLLLAAGVVHTKKYQYHFVNVSVVLMSIAKLIIQASKYQEGIVDYNSVIISVISLFYVFSILFMMLKFVSIVEEEIITSEKLKELSTKDFLTNTFNRRKLDKFDNRTGFNEFTSVLMLDFDHFKEVNDNHGHRVGDSVLIETIKIIKSFIRKDDYIIRWGGEEFVVILHNCIDDDSVLVSEKIRKIIEEKVYKFNENIKVTVSIGVTTIKENESIYATINRADKALYQAKNNGRNKVEYI
ncbi:hypothetical protein CI105_07165 [Candidatus Izimaplasma bacterium ZiA1]|uniref:GGDEF domain-containing protein n=1 Tax=Candidatus Izimoplasma sp. ZiA1 TaxID=2024899 RepID=UPI000BAA8968|nr:hypothetical protein CI105_07165 [Candidatus Izimaplasma bacterium ZiA1]